MPVNKNNCGGKRSNADRKPGRADGRRWRIVKMPLTDIEFAAIRAIPPSLQREILLQAQKVARKAVRDSTTSTRRPR